MALAQSPSAIAPLLIAAAAVTLLLRLAWFVIYNLYFHPLRKVPGPKLWAATRIPWHLSSLRGQQSMDFHKLHERYGPIVRTAPEEVCFLSETASSTIYGHRKDEMSKDTKRFTYSTSKTLSILLADRADHARHRRLMAHAFSEKAMVEQEDYLQTYVGKLIDRLSESKGPQDMVTWFNWTTFDLIGDLAFGESFHALEKDANSTEIDRYTSAVYGNIKGVSYKRIARYYGFGRFAEYLTPAALVKASKQNFATAQMKLDKRLESKADRKDFLSYMLRHNDEKGMSAAELMVNSHVLILGGSETSATTLSVLMFHILSNPGAYQTLVTELRQAFKNDEDIVVSETNNLPYVYAVIQEALRMEPPVPNHMARLVPAGGAEIDGIFVPEGMSVGVSQYAFARSSKNFHRSEEFLPERWLPSATEVDSPFYNDNRKGFRPFSFGPRNCIGRNLAWAELRLIVSKVFWHFDFSLEEESKGWERSMKDYLLWEKPELMVTVKKRQQ